jgi:hypothetical protein
MMRPSSQSIVVFIVNARSISRKRHDRAIQQHALLLYELVLNGSSIRGIEGYAVSAHARGMQTIRFHARYDETVACVRKGCRPKARAVTIDAKEIFKARLCGGIPIEEKNATHSIVGWKSSIDLLAVKIAPPERAVGIAEYGEQPRLH